MEDRKGELLSRILLLNIPSKTLLKLDQHACFDEVDDIGKCQFILGSMKLHGPTTLQWKQP